VVDVLRRGVFDPAGERLGNRCLDRLEPVLEEQGRESRLQESGENVSVADEAVELLPGHGRPALAQPGTEVELSPHHGAALPRDHVRADLRQPTLAELGVAIVERAGDGELEDAVAEELEPLVGRGAVGRPSGMGENVLEPRRWERQNQPPEAVRRSRVPPAATGGT